MSEKENAALDSDPIQGDAIETHNVEKTIAEKIQDDKIEKVNPDKPEGDQQEKEVANPPIRLGDILHRIQRLITTYIKLPSEELALLVAIWIAGTYCYKSFQYYGYLSIRSATPRCGKSQLLKLISLLSAENPPVTSFPTAAVLYRNPRKILIMDEVDQLRDQDKESYGAVLSVLNAGFERGAVIERLEKGKGDKFEVKGFEVFGPKAFAGIEKLADTLADRTFAIVLKRVSDRMPRFRADRLKGEIAEIRELLSLWVHGHEAAIMSTYAELPTALEVLKGFDDRFQDIAEPLCALAMLADQERPEEPYILSRLANSLLASVVRREPTGREESFRFFLDLVEPIISRRPYKGEDTGIRFISTQQLLLRCQDHPDLSWIESGAALAGLLRRFDLSPINNGYERGYRLTHQWYGEWRNRYPKPVIEVTESKQNDENEEFPQLMNY